MFDLYENDYQELVFSKVEVKEAIELLRINKSPDVFVLTAEHLKFGVTALMYCITEIINSFCEVQNIPDLIKLGILSPVFKRKGMKHEAKNHRGITVLPVTGKCL